ncbi:MAG: squalene/phytoene synthase family protein [Acidimicrobiia bacterium]
MGQIPFTLRRVGMLTRGLTTNRESPKLDRLASIEDPDQFVWSILPHAARSFATSIVLLPERASRAAAVGYLYARMLDTYEDLSRSGEEARQSLATFAGRFNGYTLGVAPPAPRPAVADNRDLTHILLIDRHALVDEVFLHLDSQDQALIASLVGEMAAGMIEFSETFERQGGVLDNEDQVLGYCQKVIGLPALFVMRLMGDSLIGTDTTDALEFSELIQLANITRDIEKDLARGVAYHPALRPHLGLDGTGVESKAVAMARRDLVLLAVSRAPSMRRLMATANLPRMSTARAGAVMMMLFTGRHYGSQTPHGDKTNSTQTGPTSALFFTSVMAAVSPKWSEKVLVGIENDLMAIAQT